MRTQQYIQVKALVAKYKKEAKNSEAVKNAEKAFKQNAPFSFAEEDLNVTDYEHQLLAYFYSLATSDTQEAFISKLWQKYANCYQTGIFSKEEEEYLVKNYNLLVDYLLNNADSWEHQSINLDCPFGWSELVGCLIKNKKDLRIFLPCTDKGVEISEFKHCSIVVGCGYEYAFLRKLSSDTSIERYNLPYTYKNGVWPNLQESSFDVFIAEVPSFSRQEYAYLISYLEASYNLVREGGEMLICMSREDLLGRYTLSFRKSIVQKQELAEVIQLPGNNVLLHIVKSIQSTFIMADASSITRKNGWGNSYDVVDVDLFVEKVKHSDQPEFDENPICRRFDYTKLMAEILLPQYYFHPTEGVCLSALVRIPDVLVTTEECDHLARVVTTANLSNIYSKGEILLDKLKTIDTSRARRYWKVSGPCVVMVVSKEAIAIGYYTSSDYILVPKNLYVLCTQDADYARFLSAYLLQNLEKPICSLVWGNGIIVQMCENWLSLVKLPLWSKQIQEEFVRDVTRVNWSEQEKQSHSAYMRYKEAIRLRKHAISQNISSFDSLFRTLEGCFEEQGGRLRKTDRISPVSEMTVEDAFKHLLEQLDVIGTRVSHLAEDQNWGSCESIEPQQFIEEFERQHVSADFKFSHDWEVFDKNHFEEDVLDKETGKLLFHAGESYISAWFPRTALNQVLENIVSNAKEHGFNDPNRNDYRIHFSWTTDSLNLVLKVSNNGSPISDEMSTAKILQYGYSSVLNHNGHGGIGGGQIAEIMQEFGGSVEVISTPESQQTVTYVLKMPLASLY